MRRLLSAILLGVIACAALTSSHRPARADDKDKWGTIKGRVVWVGDVPAVVELNVDKDKMHCLSKGKLVNEEFVIDPESKGLRSVFIWLEPAAKGGELPIHPDLKKPKDKEVVIDQPCCKFEPHALAMREDQDLICKNSSPIPHNFKYTGFIQQNNGNPVIPAKGQAKINLKADSRPVTVSCSIHGWMTGWIRVFDHPYFAVTDKDGNFEIKDAPAGNFRVKIWHESGWFSPKAKEGIAITIKGGQFNDLGKYEWKPKPE